ncbi:Molybdopterin cofactor biosynthesis C domain-containing protein [Boeremia exigua]|uniref:Molybdopterin cofactor biosynthesis C domain-containing protein n=1 Tax=Boeremia exigua TaxID=749465 RepID=UPI001E8D6540|nr:Molybdopterin cofactor biosynthesis C domain-containing protein [Boeremia exigua]KAH6644668.1 Molybdopterin cofactor biosynthesis C domain-containing protein [Boeremia exigua]
MQHKARRLELRRGYATDARSPASTTPKPPSDPAPSDTTPPDTPSDPPPTPSPHLPHLTPTGSAHMVHITHKPSTSRRAIAVGTVYFSNPTPLSLIRANALKKGDVLGVSRIAGIMAAKKCPEIVPLCHPIALSGVGVELRTKSPDDMAHGGVQVECEVACAGATGVEMEALTAVMGAALSVVDMCKAVDRFQRIGDVRVVRKEGGKSGVWAEEGWRSWRV